MVSYNTQPSAEILERGDFCQLCIKAIRLLGINDFIEESKILKYIPDHNNIIYVNSRDVKYFLSERPINEKSTKIVPGDWDDRNLNIDYYPSHSNSPKKADIRNNNSPSKVEIEKIELYDSFREHFINGVAWESTKFYNELINYPNNNSSKYGSSKSEICKRLKYNDYLYRQIKQNGCQPSPSLTQNIPVFIGRGGQIIHGRKGCHRLIISKILELGEIPVWVWGRHPDWDDLRNSILTDGFSNKYDSDLRNHPDLQAICD